eukprot:m.139943 g.139943  ORF g.139943 m.139943 type:complete len:54 (+) comp17072_c1_seq3:3-164(+)
MRRNGVVSCGVDGVGFDGILPVMGVNGVVVRKFPGMRHMDFTMALVFTSAAPL